MENPANWNPAQTPDAGDVLIFGPATGFSSLLSSSLSLSEIRFDSNTSGYTLSGAGTLFLNSGITNDGTAAASIAALVTLANNQTWIAATGSISVSGPVSLAGYRLTVDGANTTSLSGVISGTGGLTKVGAGTLTVSGINTYTGTTILNAGSLAVGSDQALGTGSLILNGGILQGDGAARTVANSILLQANSTVSGAEDLTFTGIFTQSGNRTLTVDGPGKVTFTGGVRLNDARPMRTLTIAGSGNVTIDSVISNGLRAKKGNLKKVGTGTLTLSGNSSNTFKGTVTVSGGTLLLGKTNGLAVPSDVTVGDGVGTDTMRLLGNEQIGELSIVTMNSGGVFALGGFSETVGALSGSGAIQLGGGSLTIGGNNTSTTYSGLLSGPGNLVKTGTGILTLSGSNNSAGYVGANAGTVLITTPGAISNQTVIGTMGTGIFDIGNISTTAGGFNLTGGIVRGSGVLTLAGDANATSSGGVAALISTRLALSGSRTFNVTAGGAASDLNLTNIISGSGGLAKSGNGVMQISAANSYTGSTEINDGTLRASGGAAIPDNSAVFFANTSGALLEIANVNETIGSLSGGGSNGGNIALGSGTLTIGANNQSTTYAGSIGGTGGLTKIGTGTLTLAGNNSYTGATTLNLGRLQLSSSAALSSSTALTLANVAGVGLDLNSSTVAIGSLAGGGASGGNVTLGTGLLAVGANNSTTIYAGAISGSGTFRKLGTGTLTLTGANSLTGEIAAAGGTLVLSGTGSAQQVGSIRIGTGASLSLDNSTTNLGDRINNDASVIFDGGSMRFVSGTANASETVGALTLEGGNSQLTLVHNGGATRSTILTFNSLGSIEPGATLSFNATGGTLGAAATGPQVYINGLAPGFIGGWATVGADFAEYSTFGVRALTGYYTGSDGINVNDPTKLVLLTSTSPASAYTLTRAGTTTDKGLNLTDLPVVDLNTSATNTLNLASGGLLKSTATPTTILGAGRLTAGGTAAGNLAVTVDQTSNLTISVPIIDNAGVNGVYLDADDRPVSVSKGGDGLLILSGANTYTGSTFINAGTLRISAEGNLGVTNSPVVFNGGTLQVTKGFAASSSKIFSVAPSISATLDIAGGQTLSLGTAMDTLRSGNSASQLRKSGVGTLTLRSSNPGFTGVFQHEAGILELQSAQALGGTLRLNGGSLFLRADANTIFVNNVVVMSDSTIDVGGLTGTTSGMTHSVGSMSIGPVTLTISSAGNGTLNVGSVSLTGNGTIATTTGNLKLGSLSGAFGLTKSGAGILDFAGASTYSGATALSAGTLRGMASEFTSPFSAMSIETGALLDLNGFNASVASLSGTGNVSLGLANLTAGLDNSSFTFSGSMNGGGSFTKTGSGMMTLSGPNTYIGQTTILGGTLRIGASERIANTSPVVIAAGAALNLNGFNETIGSLTGPGSLDLSSGALNFGGNNLNAAFPGVIAGTGSVTKTGSGTQVFAGANTYSGATLIAAGALNVQHDSALGASTYGTTVLAGGELQLQGDVIFDAEPLTLSGAGALGNGALRNVSHENEWGGAITLAAPSTIGADAGILTISGLIAMGANTLTIQGVGSVRIEGQVSGFGSTGLVKTGTGFLTLTEENTYAGSTEIKAGALIMHSPATLGLGNIPGGGGGGTSIFADAALWMDDSVSVSVQGEGLILNGLGIGGTGALLSIQGANLWGGPATLATDSSIGVNADSLLISGAIGELGTRSLTKTGAGELVLSGVNTYSGTTLVNQGTLRISSTGRLSSSNISVAPSATFTVSSGAIIPASSTLTVNGSATFHNPTQAFASISGSAGGQITLNGTALSIGSGVLDGSIQNGSNPGSVEKTGPGILVLNGTNTYSGNTVVSGGVLAVSSAAALGVGSTLIFEGGTLRANASFSLSRAVVFGIGGGKIDTNTHQVVLGGSLSGATLFTKMGLGTMTISGAANGAFSGGVQVDRGLLRVTGFLAAPVSIASGAALDGTGSVGAVSAFSGSTVEAGVGIGSLQVGNLSLASGATLRLELGGTAPVTGYDQLNVAGSVTLGGNLQIGLLNGFIPNAGDRFFVLLNDGIEPISGSFAGIAQNASVTFGGQSFVVSYTGDFGSGNLLGGNDVVLRAIPEPTTAQTLVPPALFLLGMLRLRRR